MNWHKNLLTYYQPYYFSRLDILVASLMGILSIGFYTYYLTPSISAGDNGELTTAIFYLGVAHAPGYPLHSLLGKLATFIPLHSVAWRANLFSAICGGVTLFFCFLVYLKLICSCKINKSYAYLASIVATLVFMMSETLWSQATICEVYTISSIFHPLLILILLRWHDEVYTRRDSHFPYFGERYLLAYAFLFGVALCAHQTIIMTELFVLVFVLYGLLVYVILPRKLSKPMLFGGMVSLLSVILMLLFAWLFYYYYILRLNSNLYANNNINVKIGVSVFLFFNFVMIGYYLLYRFIFPESVQSHNTLQKLSFTIIKMFMLLYLGFAIYLYMIIRSHGNPPINWMGISEAQTAWGKLGKFFNALHRKQFGNVGKIAFTLPNIIEQFRLLITSIHAKQFTIPFYLIAALGIIQLARRYRLWLIFMIIMLVTYNFQLTLFLGYDFTERSIFFVKVFYIFSYFSISILIAFGLTLVLETLQWCQTKITDLIGDNTSLSKKKVS